MNLIPRALRFVRLPMLLIMLWAIFRLVVGLRGVPYAPRGNAMFSVVGITIISAIYYGAISKRVGRFGWRGTVVVGGLIGLWAQIFVFTLTFLSFFAGWTSSYYLHPDSVGVPEGTAITAATLAGPRIGGLVVNCIIAVVAACIGRLLGVLAPKPETEGLTDRPKRRRDAETDIDDE